MSCLDESESTQVELVLDNTWRDEHQKFGLVVDTLGFLECVANERNVA